MQVLQTLTTGDGIGRQSKLDLNTAKLSIQSTAEVGSAVDSMGNERTTHSSSTPEKSKASAKGHLLLRTRTMALKLAIMQVVFFLYVPMGMCLYLFAFLTEIIPTNYQGLYIAKCLCDVFIWLSTTLYSFYLLFKVFSTAK
ncbi:hypothetical protein HDU91_002905 [Kappamyces sp. JEL0680]|nr:hypothetical protein HDU91_002905 [Kappamyces sp. JEL0680]